MPSIGIVAGEVSGDILGADLISAIRKQCPEMQFIGIGGDRMKSAGCDCLYPVEKLSVMGISEVFRHFRELSSVRNSIRGHFLNNRPDVFIGIDAPDFNFPFEPAYYEKYNIPVRFVGHPLASKINLEPDQGAARGQLGLSEADKIIALMPGSRKSELGKLVEPFLKTALWCNQHAGQLHFVVNLVNEDTREYFEECVRKISPEIHLTTYTGSSLQVMEAADVVLLASGTAALEAMLLKRPMVVAYKVR